MQVAPDLVLRGHQHAVNCVLFVQKNKLLLTGDSNGEIKIWNLSTRRCAQSIRMHQDSVLSLNILQNDKIASSSKDGNIKVWELDNMNSSAFIEMGTGSSSFCNVSVDRAGLLSEWQCSVFSASSERSNVLHWDIRNPHNPTMITTDSACGLPTALHFTSSNGPLLWIGFEDGSLSAVDCRNTRFPIASVKHHSDPVLCIESSRTQIFSGGADSTLNRLELTQDNHSGGRVLEMLASQSLRRAGTAAVRMRRDGRLLVSAHWDHTLRLWDRRLRPLGVLRHHRDSVFAVDFERGEDGAEMQCGSLFASGAKDGSVAVWSALKETFNFERFPEQNIQQVESGKEEHCIT